MRSTVLVWKAMCERLLPGMASISTRSTSSSPTRRSATAVWAGLAACFLDSMATLGIPGIGYGIRYEYGMFRQELADGWQVEKPDEWLSSAHPWEFHRPERTYAVSFGGKVEHRDQRAHWVAGETVHAVAYDRLVPGFDSDTVNTLRLWSPNPTDPIDLSAFNRGAFLDALAGKVHAKTVARVLYPDNSTAEGKELRLRQQYFFVSASVQDVLARFLADCSDWNLLPHKVAIHLNDTHPALASVELMHRLVDVHGVEWERAWHLTQAVCAYTNHTLMPEALETWPIELMARLLPRHCELIKEIERRFLDHVSKLPDAETVRPQVCLIVGSDHTHVNMGRLSTLASHRVNGVSRLHSDLVRESLFPEFALHVPRPVRERHQRHYAAPLAHVRQPAVVSAARRYGRSRLAARLRQDCRFCALRRRRRLP